MGLHAADTPSLVGERHPCRVHAGRASTRSPSLTTAGVITNNLRVFAVSAGTCRLKALELCSSAEWEWVSQRATDFQLDGGLRYGHTAARGGEHVSRTTGELRGAAATPRWRQLSSLNCSRQTLCLAVFGCAAVVCRSRLSPGGVWGGMQWLPILIQSLT